MSTDYHGTPTTVAGALVAAIVQKNTDDAYATSQALIAYEHDNAVRLAAGLLALDRAIEACVVVDRRLLQAQDRLGPVIDLAEHLVAREESS
jgi:hypothetical protein